jgi:hypothetical protein
VDPGRLLRGTVREEVAGSTLDTDGRGALNARNVGHGTLFEVSGVRNFIAMWSNFGMLLERHLRLPIERALERFPVILLFGPDAPSLG